MAAAQTYQSEFTGEQMDARFAAVATLTAALEELTTVVAGKYVKPADGIPSTDMTAAVQASLAKAESAVQSLADYYTKTEVDQLLAAINGMDYVDVSTLPTASASTMGKIYLVGPDASGYYSYYYTSYNGSAYSWVGPLGTTEISLANYATKTELGQLDQKVTQKTGGQYTPILNLEQGAITSSTGADTSSITRIRTGNYVYADTIAVSTSGSKVYVMGYKNDGTFIASAGWKTTSEDVTIAGADKYRLVFAKSNDATITPDEYASLNVDIKAKYVGTFPSQIGALDQDFNTIISPISLNITPETMAVNGKYINSEGTEKTNASYGYSNPIAVATGERIIVSGVGSMIPIFVNCDSTGSFISAGPNSAGIGVPMSYVFQNNGYIRLNGRIANDGNGQVSGVIMGNDVPTLEEVKKSLGTVWDNMRKYVATRGATYSRTVAGVGGIVVVLNTLFVYDIETNSLITVSDSTSYTLTNSPRFLVLTKEHTIATRNSSTHILDSDLVLLYYDDDSANKDIVGGALFPDYIAKCVNLTGLNEDVPENIGVYNAIRKAKQFANIKWTPIAATMPYNSGIFNKDVEKTGMVYSSVKEYNQFVAEDVSFETFMTAVKNPRSVLYTENISADNSQSALGRTYHGTNCACYYGSVCSGLVTFAFGLPMNVTTYEFHTWDEMLVVDDQSAYGAKLADVLWQSGHIVFIAGITRKEHGIISDIMLIENAGATTTTKHMTPEQFDTYMATGGYPSDPRPFTLMRYKKIYENRVYLPQTGFVTVDDETPTTYVYNTDICPNYGNKANYNVGDDVVLNLRTDYADEGFDTLEVYKDDTLLISRSISDEDETLTGLAYGDYKARITGTGVASEYAEFKVVDAQVAKDGTAFAFSSENATPVYYEFCDQAGGRDHNIVGLSTHVFTSEELAAGEATPSGSVVSSNDYHYLKVHFQTSYGRAIKVIDWNNYNQN